MPAASRGGGRGQTYGVDAHEFVDLLADAKAFDANLGRGLRRNIRVAGGRAVKAAQAEIRNAPTHGDKHTGLRARIAAGIRLQIATSVRSSRVGVFVQATSSKLPDSQKALVRAFNRPTFRHRAWGRDTWVVQKGHPYFDEPIRRHERDVQAAVDSSLDEAARALGRSRKGKL